MLSHSPRITSTSWDTLDTTTTRKRSDGGLCNYPGCFLSTCCIVALVATLAAPRPFPPLPLCSTLYIISQHHDWRRFCLPFRFRILLNVTSQRLSELSVNEWMREARLYSTYLYLESENITGSDWAETSDFQYHNKRGGLVGG